MSTGVNVTGWFAVPTPGVAEGVVKAKPPVTFAPKALVTAPPLNVDALNVWPLVMVVAVGMVPTVRTPSPLPDQ